MKLQHNLKDIITPELVYKNRRRIIKSFFINSAFAKMFLLNNFANSNDKVQVLNFIKNKKFSTYEKKTNFKAITTYNNFYEFGTDKKDPKKKSKNFTTKNWILEITGNVKKAKKFSFEELLKISTLEERILRLRCVEAWSMVIPWIGYSLSNLLKKVEILGNAKYVKFTSVLRPEQMPGQKFPVLDWPYVEGLRIDEAMHPLTTLVLGLYGQLLPNQNGAPVRLIVPWKYGFKSPKSLVKIDLVEEKPITSWVSSSPKEYGFFSNVNPNVNHPRWSQKKERRIGEFKKRKTRLFNGYEEDVANLYSNMDLDINF